MKLQLHFKPHDMNQIFPWSIWSNYHGAEIHFDNMFNYMIEYRYSGVIKDYENKTNH